MTPFGQDFVTGAYHGQLLPRRLLPHLALLEDPAGKLLDLPLDSTKLLQMMDRNDARQDTASQVSDSAGLD